MRITGIVAQTLVEYGFLNSLVAGLVSARDRIEFYIGQGNLKYLLLGTLAVIVLLLARRRR